MKGASEKLVDNWELQQENIKKIRMWGLGLINPAFRQVTGLSTCLWSLIDEYFSDPDKSDPIVASVEQQELKALLLS